LAHVWVLCRAAGWAAIATTAIGVLWCAIALGGAIACLAIAAAAIVVVVALQE
jgi:hypothetical protein